MGNASSNTGQPPKRNQKRGQGSQGYSAFSQRQREALRKRYRHHDPKERNGIPLDVCLAMPEFTGNKLISILIHDFLDPDTGRLYLTEFLSFCSFLSSNTSAEDKKKALFETFNVYGTEVFTHDEIYRLYKVLLDHVVSDDHILALTFEALKHPSLSNPGQITKAEFLRMIPDSEIEEKLTIRFNIPSS